MERQQSRTILEKKIPEKISAKPINEADNIFFILPSYTEKFKEDIKKKSLRKKSNCASKKT